MTKILAAALLAALAPGATPASAGCVDDLTNDSFGPYVTRNPDGSVTLHPAQVSADALRSVGAAGSFAGCV